jgi:hypothetical protein
VDEVPVAVAESPAPLTPQAQEVLAPKVIDPPSAAPAFATFWEFAVALNRSEPAAVALAGNGAAA